MSTIIGKDFCDKVYLCQLDTFFFSAHINKIWAHSMKTASLGLLEVMVVRVNAGGDAPSVVTSRAGPFPLSLFSSRKDFWRMSGIIFLARALENYEKPHKTRTNKWRA
jgi:hypothetical protein